MTPSLSDAFRESLAAAAVREGLLDAVFTRVATPIGRLLVVQGALGIVRVGFEEDPEDRLLAEVAAGLGPRILPSDRELAADARAARGLLRGRGGPARAAGRPAAGARARSGARCSRRCTATWGAARRSPTARSPPAPAIRARPARWGPPARATRSRSSSPATASCRAPGASAATAAGRRASSRCSSSRARCRGAHPPTRERRHAARAPGVARAAAALTLADGDRADDDRVARRLDVARHRGDPVDRLHPAGHLAQQRVVGRQGELLGHHDEELAARRARRARRRSWPSRRRRAGSRGPPAASRRPSSPGRPIPSPSGSPPWITKAGTIRWNVRPSKKPLRAR